MAVLRRRVLLRSPRERAFLGEVPVSFSVFSRGVAVVAWQVLGSGVTIFFPWEGLAAVAFIRRGVVCEPGPSFPLHGVF